VLQASSAPRRVGTLMGVAASGCMCERCTTDRAFLTTAARPSAVPAHAGTVRAVDLFAGCGGLTCGLDEAARRAGRRLDVVLAMEHDEAIAGVFKANFARAHVVPGDVAAAFDGDLGAPLTTAEHLARLVASNIDVLVAGPPCQGHSDLNNHTRRADPKNALYLRVARAVEVLLPRLVVIENVPPVQWDKTNVVDATRTHLEKLGYSVHGEVVDLRYTGVPQTRKRFLLVASRLDAFVPLMEVGALQTSWGDHGARNVEWAIADLRGKEGSSLLDTAARSSEDNKKRIDYLFDNEAWDLPDSERPDCHRLKEHSYRSVYGRLWWDKPAPTVTTGFGSMGQGRYVHPLERRTLTPHEAARLQSFPDWYSWPTKKRTVLSTMIGNAVPPLLMVSLGERLIAALGSQS
jgi:DNA (cytosine-5)-methyltransferase 1